MDFTMPTISQWEAMYSSAKQRFVDKIGDRPTWKSVADNTNNINKLGTMEYTAMLTLLLIFIYTSFKAMSLSIDFVDNMIESMVHTNSWLSPLVVDTIKIGFTIATVGVNIVMASPAFIFFKIRSTSPKIVEKIRATEHLKGRHRISLLYITPRLNSIMVYVSLAWMFGFSTLGFSSILETGNLLLILVDAFTRYLPVIAEVTLAGEVGEILANNFEFRKVVYDKLHNEQDNYDKKLNGYERDREFLSILYRTIRQDIVRLRISTNKRGQYAYPNKWLEGHEDLDRYVYKVANYYLKGADSFADEMTEQVYIVPSENATQRVPPDGKATWTVSDMIHEFRLMGLSPSMMYNRRNLDNDFASGYDARKAWADGAKDYFA